MSARALDHLVLPVAGLDAARARLSALGFTVAPQGNHPFGTVNACVYFADRTFIEPLATGDAATVAAAIAADNSFVLGDARFRAALGEEGFSAIVLASGDAAADHDAFTAGGVSGGAMVEFSRPSLDRDGKADIASFRLAFAAPSGGADALFFACEPRKVPSIDRSALERHENGVTRILAVHAEAADPASFAAFLAGMAGGAVGKGDNFAGIALQNATIDIRRNGEAARPRLTGVTYGVRDLAAVAALFRTNGVVCARQGAAIHVPPARGQGTAFMFEETP